MLTVSNLDHMRSNVMRKLFDLFEVAYHVQMEEDLRVSYYGYRAFLFDCSKRLNDRL